MSTAMRSLVVNADDLGLCPAVNAGVFAAFDEGIVTSASLMVRRPAAEAAAVGVRERPELGAGLHLDLAEWAYADGEWHAVYVLADTDDRDAVAAELCEQLDRFRALIGRDPTHIDSHQHVHRSQPVTDVVCEAAADLGIPVRGLTPGISHCGAFYGQTRDGTPLDVGPPRLARLLRELPAGTTELACHPARGMPADPLYREPRARELEALCDARVAATVRSEGINLCSFAALRMAAR